MPVHFILLHTVYRFGEKKCKEILPHLKLLHIPPDSHLPLESHSRHFVILLLFSLFSAIKKIYLGFC